MRASSLVACFSLAVALWGVAAPTAKARPRSVGPSSVALIARQPKSNDLDPHRLAEGPTVPVPDSVARAFREVVDQSFAQFQKMGPCPDCGISEQSFVGPVVRIAGPNGLQLFVFQLKGVMGGNDYFTFVLFDPTTGALSGQPRSVYAKWMLGGGPVPLQKPVIRFADFDADGRPDLVVEELVHNGTVYNALMYHYYAIGPDLSLRHALAIETNMLEPSAQSSDSLHRRIEAASPLELRLTTSVHRADGSEREVGGATLVRDNTLSPFRIRERRILVERYRDMLITLFGPADEEKILREGYTFYY